MRALILGAGGQIGRALAGTAPDGTDLIALGRSQCDVTLADAVEAAVADARADIVLNAAAYTAVDAAESDSERAYRLNAVAPGLIAAATARAGARLIHISTDFVFDGSGGSPLAPDAATRPLNVYGRTKLEGERAAQAADPQVLIVRTSWVYSAVGRNFVATMLRLMREQEEVTVIADQIGSPTWAPSLACALWHLAAAGAQGIQHYTDSGVASWYDFAVAIEEEGRAAGLLERNVRVVPAASADFLAPARRPGYAVLDKSETWLRLGGPAPHWRSNLRRHMQELRAFG